MHGQGKIKVENILLLKHVGSLYEYIHYMLNKIYVHVTNKNLQAYSLVIPIKYYSFCIFNTKKGLVKSLVFET